MCGVIGLIYERARRDLGVTAAELLQTLEYRGYDSTGAAFQDEGEDVRLVKGVGAPSVMVHKLGILGMSGQILCGQVRWATFGAVTEANAQPHDVHCKTHVYGAHNGNVTNCDALKTWLVSEGHDVRSDNDGEMVVHTVEHFFALALAGLPAGSVRDSTARIRCMRSAIATAAARLEGSFAAVIVDPVSRTLWAIKLGSSLYFGLGKDPAGGAFGIASSDLSSVLKLTRVLLPLAEGELVEFDARHHQVFALDRRTGTAPAALSELERAPVRSRLRAEDTALVPPFETFMDQEISAQESTVGNVVRLFLGGTEAGKALRPHLETLGPQGLERVHAGLEHVREQLEDEALRERFFALVELPELHALIRALPADVRAQVELPRERLGEALASSEAGFFADLAAMARGPDDLLALRLLDALLERDEQDEAGRAIGRFVDICGRALERGGRLFVVCCGSSFNAAKAGALFFNDVAHVELVPILPGEFRGQYARSLRDGDVIIAVSQSGETKDLIDVLNDVITSRRAVARIGLVNNVNSTLAQEKCELVIPLRCGPEIAVPATKRFMNQMSMFYGLALELGRRRAGDATLDPVERDELKRAVEARWDKLPALPALLRATFDATGAEIETAAHLLYLRPSLHILATRLSAVAREGALKIREVVLNHAEGFEGSEFKHGPNTILGFNTVWGPLQVRGLLERVGQTVDALLARAAAAGLGAESARRLAQATIDRVLSATPSFSLTADEEALARDVVHPDEVAQALYADYPLVYVTGPDERDVALTVSALNTHKIRGSCTVVIAEESAALGAAATKAPVDNPGYRAVCITLPRTNDGLLTVFSSTLVLQRLALKMSLLKGDYLDHLGVRDHGVHPDVPKNVSKSITVD